MKQWIARKNGRKIFIWALLLITGFVFFNITLNKDRKSNSISFSHRIIDAHPPSGSGCCLDVCAVGDIDGDGRGDIMLGSEHATGAVWYHAPDWTRYPVGQGDFTTDGEIFDIDQDGDNDIIISCISRDEIEWWENSGDPLHGNWERHTIGPGFSHDLAIGDINGDTFPEVVTFRKDNRNNIPKQLNWFQNPGSKTGTWIKHPIDFPDGEGLDVGDIDGDGDLDIAASKRWYENNNGDGSVWTTHMISDSWGDDCRDIIADINQDGLKDIVLSHSEGDGGISWFENPDWNEHKIEPGILNGAHSLEVADFDMDGDPDVLTGEMHTSPENRVLVYENTGEGKSWLKTVLSRSGTHNARKGDIDGDGDTDIVGKNYDGEKVLEVWENLTIQYNKAR